MTNSPTRRRMFRHAAIAGAAVCGLAGTEALGQTPGGKDEPEVTAAEDLMREHGVIRRVLLVYAHVTDTLRSAPGSVDVTALRGTAQLFRAFGEDYHERMLEEQHIFPVVRRMKGEAARYPDILVAQHARGRDITDYVLTLTSAARLGASDGEPLARALEHLVLMYQHHAAREDTIVFPAWKTNFSSAELDRIGDQFEAIERKMFGRDGFEDAVKKIGGIEAMLGLSDISQFTPPPPSKR
jgi:hemerythrin-like domain-containing protein